jgi:hypothetical protein
MLPGGPVRQPHSFSVPSPNVQKFQYRAGIF